MQTFKFINGATWLVLIIVSSGNWLCASVIVSIGQNFTGTVSNHDRYDPSPSGAASEDYVVEFSREQFDVHSKGDGSVMLSMSTVDFWAGAGITPYANTCWTGARVIFDPTVQRWFVAQVVDNCDLSVTTAQLWLAVSEDANPTAAWNGVILPETPGNVSHLSTVFMGLDARGVYLSSEVWLTNQNVRIPTGTELWALPKADLLAVPPIISNRTSFGQLLTANYGYSLDPAIALDGSAGENVLAPASAGVDANGNAVTNNNLVSFAIENALGPGPATLTPTQALRVLPYTQPSSYALQPDGSTNLVDGNAEFTSQVYRVGDVLFAAHALQLGPRVALRWYRVSATDQQLLEAGTITDPRLDLYFPSIAANTNGTVVLAFNGSGADAFVSCYAVVGQTVKGVTTFGQPLLLQAGTASYQNPLSGKPFSTWGFYSTTCVDPADVNIFWTVNTFASGSTSWSTQITQLLTIPVPQLSIANTGAKLLLFWPLSTVPFQLQSSTSLGSNVSWSPVTSGTITNANIVSISLANSGTGGFFRLIQR